MKSNLEILREMREILARENGWTQGMYHLSKPFFYEYSRNEPIPAEYHVNSEKPTTCHCLVGAYELVTGLQSHLAVDSLLDFGFRPGERDAVTWQDLPGRTQAEVLARIDEAIEREGKNAVEV